MNKRFTLSFLLLAFVAQAQVIPVGFMKRKALPSTPIPNNLLLYLDASKTDSYGGTGTTWTDISGQSNNASLVNPTFYTTGPYSTNPNTNAPTFGSNSFTFALNTYAKTTNTLDFSLGTGTFIAWVNPSKIHTVITSIIFSRSGYGTGLNLYSSNNRIGYHWNDIADTYNWNSNLSVPINQWSMIAVSISTSSATAYLINSIGTSTATNSISHPATSGHNFYIACDPTQYTTDRTFIGKMGTAMVYSTALTSAEIATIFNAQKAAFGL